MYNNSVYIHGAKTNATNRQGKEHSQGIHDINLWMSVCGYWMFSVLGLSHCMTDLLKYFAPSLWPRAINCLCPLQISSLRSGPVTVLSRLHSQDYCQTVKRFGEMIIQVLLFPAQVGLKMKISQYFCLLCKVINILKPILKVSGITEFLDFVHRLVFWIWDNRRSRKTK